MRSSTKKSAKAGFTLIEVMVALAIAGGALVLILTADGASLRKSAEARLAERLERVAESKFAEWKAGAERAAEGPIPGFDGLFWEVRSAREDMPPLRTLIRVRFLVRGPGGQVLEWMELRDTAVGTP